MRYIFVGIIITGAEVFHLIMGDIINNIKKALGFDTCENGGTFDRYMDECRCGKYYRGKRCETMLCANRSDLDEASQKCICLDDVHFKGLHCETMVCENDGRPDPRKPGYCKCAASYVGQFCQTYSNPWGIVIGSVAGVLLLLVVAWMGCQWYWSKREFDGSGDDEQDGTRRAASRYRNRARYGLDPSRLRNNARGLRLIMPPRPVNMNPPAGMDHQFVDPDMPRPVSASSHGRSNDQLAQTQLPLLISSSRSGFHDYDVDYLSPAATAGQYFCEQDRQSSLPAGVTVDFDRFAAPPPSYEEAVGLQKTADNPSNHNSPTIIIPRNMDQNQNFDVSNDDGPRTIAPAPLQKTNSHPAQTT